MTSEAIVVLSVRKQMVSLIKPTLCSADRGGGVSSPEGRGGGDAKVLNQFLFGK